MTMHDLLSEQGIEPFDEGGIAHHAGKSRSANPFMNDSDEADLWDDGWLGCLGFDDEETQLECRRERLADEHIEQGATAYAASLFG